MPPLELALYRGRKIRLMDDFRILGQNRGFRAGGAQNFLAYFDMKLFSVRKIGCFFRHVRMWKESRGKRGLLLAGRTSTA